MLPAGKTVEIGRSVRVEPSGHLEIDRYLSGGNRVMVDRIFGVVGEEDDTIFCTASMIAEWGLPEDLVLLDGDGHCWLAFDYRSKRIDPPVIVIESLDCSWLTIAPGLGALLS